MQRRLRADFGRELTLRIGVNTGEVVSGRPREGSSFVSGDAACSSRFLRGPSCGR